MPPIDFSVDKELLIVLVAVVAIITLQILATIYFLCYRNYKEKARWQRLRQEGIVLLEGPTMYWTDDLSIPPVPIQFNAPRSGQAAHTSSQNLISGPQGLATSQQHDTTSER